MFKRGKRPPAYRIVVRGASGALLADVPEAEFTLPEAATIALSIEYFDDPEPCEIHRAAVRWRAVQQLRAACPAGAETPVSALEPGLRALLPPGAETVRIVEAAP